MTRGSDKHKGTRSCISFHYVQQAIYRCKNKLQKKLKVREAAGPNWGLRSLRTRLASIKVCSRHNENSAQTPRAYTVSFARPCKEPGVAE